MLLEVSVDSNRSRSSFVYLIFIIGIAILLFFNYRQSVTSQEILSINEVATQIQQGVITRVLNDETEVHVIYQDGSEGLAYRELTSTLVEQLRDLGVTTEALSSERVKIEVRPPSQWVGIITALSYLAPIVLLGAMFWFIFRQAQGGGNAAMSFGKSRARLFAGDQPTVSFDDVGGIEESKAELEEIVEFLKEPEKFIALGARIPKGVLLVGPPGTGKTLLAKAVSGEAGVPFFTISGSEFVEMFVGVGASRVRDLFEQAKKNAPCIVFVDEIDAVGRQRGAGLGGSHDEREQTLNQMLVEMDGFDTDTNVIIVAATNRPDILDPALLRPGRFDRRVHLDRPDMRGREAILKIHVRGKPLDSDVDLTQLSQVTPGFVGADIENMVNEGAILAARREKKSIGQDEFQEAIERVIAGPERKSRLISKEEKRIIAYHEAGHAVVANALPEADAVHKISIIARGQASGYTLILPEQDRTLMAKKKILADMIGLLGGRAAEELVFTDITSGAANDIERVTRLARQMVTRLGMSEAMGAIVYGQKEEMIFLGREISEQRDYSESVAEQIDAEVRRIINDAHEQAKDILVKYRDKLDAVAEKLLEVETLSREEFEAIFPPPQEKNGGTPLPQGI
ncbi:MAG: ATP-dependent zinc metalloprotease FtsH [Anaerolineae bacterium]|nr:ATP-dependent zinc metalloprotease FtsH [Anaerolineae bacterium]